MVGTVIGLLLVGGLVGAVTLAIRHSLRQQADRHEQALDLMVREADGWSREAGDLGPAAIGLAGRLWSCPAGARRVWLDDPIHGPSSGAPPTAVPLESIPSRGGPGPKLSCTVLLTRWACEQRTRDGQRDVHVTAHLPLLVARPLADGRPLDPDLWLDIHPPTVGSALARRRPGTSLESERFNRSFTVLDHDPRTSVLLLDPGMQQLLLERFLRRSVAVADGLLVINGPTTTRDTRFPGDLASYPGLLDDLHLLLATIPPAFWRAAAPGPDQR